jgi:regulatory protein
MQITRLKSTKRGDRVNVYLDDKFAFSIAQNLVTDFAFYVGKELAEGKVNEIKNKDLVVRYYERVLNLIARRPRSELEIRRYLNRKLYREEGIEKFIDKLIGTLKKKNYIDDFEFAKWWVENRMRFKPRGEFLIRRELKSKGIEDSLIEEALRSGRFTKGREFEFALELGKKKKRLLKDLKEDKEKKKFMDFLVRKGFSYDVARRVLERLN